ncbi:MAG TPA: histidine phosphatase family protein [Acidimicrobiales bacterium]|nr:histidine phosphatase family protein [Acidimicrobiales bacterium]
MERHPGTLWLVRHGESTWNALGLVQGQKAEPELTPRGRDQAEAVARALSSSLAGRSLRAVYSSDLRRAVQTAAPVTAALGLAAVADPRLRERSFGDVEGLPSRLLGTQHSGFDGERVVDADASPPGGESIRDLVGRTAGFVEDVLVGVGAGEVDDGTGGDVVLVVHGGVVRALLAWLDGVEPDRMAWGAVGNGLVVGRPLAATRRASMSAA